MLPAPQPLVSIDMIKRHLSYLAETEPQKPAADTGAAWVRDEDGSEQLVECVDIEREGGGQATTFGDFEWFVEYINHRDLREMCNALVRVFFGCFRGTICNSSSRQIVFVVLTAGGCLPMNKYFDASTHLR